MSQLINSARLLDDLFAQGRIGWRDGEGLQRIAYSPAYLEARSWLQSRMEEAGLKTRIDGVGNLFGRMEGKRDKTILLGSHLDSVNNGGIYDGALGIVAALEVARTFKERGETLNHSVEVAAFIGEEGEPLGGTFGSRVFAGLLPSDYCAEKLKLFGVSEQDIASSKGELDKYAAFLELHIEQGPVLERKNLSIGIPSGIVGITRFGVTVSGQANHAGTTPMKERKDALKAAAFFITRWFAWMDEHDDIVCNIGFMQVKPGHVSVIPEEVYFPVEIRSINRDSIEKACDELRWLAGSMPVCSVSMQLTGEKQPVMLDKGMTDVIRRCAEDLGLPYMIMPSGASHDSVPLSHVIPTGMIFVPSRNGISHSKEEFTEDCDVINGTFLLASAVRELDKLI